MDLTADIIKYTKIFLNAEERVVGDFTFITFTIKKDGENSNLYNALTKEGLVSITLNGGKGMIGTYSLSAVEAEFYNCFYSDKLISIPFGEEPIFFTKKVIIIIGVFLGILIFMGCFAYLFTKKKEKRLDTV